jgi:putative transposase
MGLLQEKCAFYVLDAWQIEIYQRGLKQNTDIERGQFRLLDAQKNQIGLAIRAFARLEAYRLKTGISWFEAKQTINRQAVCSYLKNHPLILLTPA